MLPIGSVGVRDARSATITAPRFARRVPIGSRLDDDDAVQALVGSVEFGIKL